MIQKHYYKYWTDMIKPKSFEVDEKSLSETYGKFYLRPLEKSYGITIGNSLRRVLLSSMMGSSVSAVKIDGVLHEFSTIPDVLEDVTDIILNLKEVRLRQFSPEDQTLYIEKTGPGKVTAKDIQTNQNVEVINSDKHIATLGEAKSFRAEIIVSFDRGYVEASDKKDRLPSGFIPIDAVHSPIKRVNYNVNSARVGRRTDYDSLALEVWTDGSISPEESVSLASKILKEQLQVFINFEEGKFEKEKIKEVKKDIDFNENLFESVDGLELSVRSANCLKNANIRYIGELVVRSEGEMLKTKNFGRKSLNEIKEILEKMGLSLGMNIEGWPPSDFYERAKEKEAEKSTTVIKEEDES